MEREIVLLFRGHEVNRAVRHLTDRLHALFGRHVRDHRIDYTTQQPHPLDSLTHERRPI